MEVYVPGQMLVEARLSATLGTENSMVVIGPLIPSTDPSTGRQEAVEKFSQALSVPIRSPLYVQRRPRQG